MQYPVIDLISQAYLNNGWTGLSITSVENDNLIGLYNKTYDDEYINIKAENGIITFTIKKRVNIVKNYNFICDEFTVPVSIGNSGNGCLYLFNSIDIVKISLNFYYDLDRVEQWVLTPLNRVNSSYTSMQNRVVNNIVIQFSGQFTAGMYGTIKPMITNDGIIYNEFIPWNPPATDLDKRLKLPMIHYFPHPVIDALQRAAAGTQTADDTEILRHYLTPLGIGGI